MDDIPEVQKDLVKHAVSLSKGKAVLRGAAAAPQETSPTKQDRVEVSPMSKWLEMLKEMPDEFVDNAMKTYQQERLEDVAKKLESGYYNSHFDDEVFPTLFNELTQDWDIKFDKEPPKN